MADYLFARGFRILGRNVRVGRWEIDVLARRRELVVAVEVRFRGERSFERALESVGPAKRARLLRAVDELWRRHLAAVPAIERVRIDVAAVTFGKEATVVEHIEGGIAS